MQDSRCLPGIKEKEGKRAYGLAHNLGLGGSCVVTLFSRPSFYDSSSSTLDGRARLGYNHGAECRPISSGDVEKVNSRKAFSSWAAARL
ncbi:hypothetical protein JCM10213_000705 [Rhodosporidiobolus nylandii]